MGDGSYELGTCALYCVEVRFLLYHFVQSVSHDGIEFRPKLSASAEMLL